MIMLLIAGSVIFGRFMAVSRIPFELASWTASLDLPAFMVMAVILFIYLILGCFIDALAMILLTIPIFYPIAVDTLGYDPIWFGVSSFCGGYGGNNPPVGMNIYILKGSTDIPLETMFRESWPFLLAIIVCLVLIMIFRRSPCSCRI